jgi:uncharacterized membrane protein
MSSYSLLLVAHIICVIVWLGTGTTVALLAAYAGGSGDRELVDRLPALARWLGPRVVGPSSMGTLLFGILLAVDGDLGFGQLWLLLALSAFASSVLLNVGVRLPATLRRERAVADGRVAEAQQAERLLLEVPSLELAILYLAVADMVLKPTSGDGWWLAGGAAFLVLVVVRLLLRIRRPSQPAMGH